MILVSMLVVMNMEFNSRKTSHLDSNTLLPPRRRLLACLKKPIPDIDLSIFEGRVNNFMSSCLGNPNLSVDEAVEACKNDAASAINLAMRKRALALEKAETAAKAMAAAKKALELVACMSEDDENKERYLKKTVMKAKSSSGKSTKNKRPKLNGNGFTGDVHNFKPYESMLKLDKLKGAENGEQEGPSQLSK